jgi:predicted transcriptional regulator
VVLIFDEEYNLLGLIRRRDMLRGIEPKSLVSILSKADDDEREAAVDKVIELIRKWAERPVSDVMRRLEHTLDYDDNLIEIADKIVDANLSLLPVIKDGEVVGVVRTVELVHEIARETA